MRYSKSQVIKTTTDVVHAYQELFERVILFGSYARGDYNERSDVDLYIECEKSSGKVLTSKAYREFHTSMYDAFSDNMEFDFLVFGGITEKKKVRESLLYRQVLKDGVVLYDKGAKAV